jgi:hypothetical protein
MTMCFLSFALGGKNPPNPLYNGESFDSLPAKEGRPKDGVVTVTSPYSFFLMMKKSPEPPLQGGNTFFILLLLNGCLAKFFL